MPCDCATLTILAWVRITSFLTDLAVLARVAQLARAQVTTDAVDARPIVLAWLQGTGTGQVFAVATIVAGWTLATIVGRCVTLQWGRGHENEFGCHQSIDRRGYPHAVRARSLCSNKDNLDSVCTCLALFLAVGRLVGRQTEIR